MPPAATSSPAPIQCCVRWCSRAPIRPWPCLLYTSDLMQYLFAADRGNPRVSDRYDPLSPPALRALKTIQTACADSGTPVSVCGEMAGRPLEAFALVALGFERLSMPPGGIGPVKQMVLSCDREAARRGVSALLKSTAGSIRNELETLARKQYVAV